MTRYPLVRTSTPGIYRRGAKYVVVVRDNRRRQVKRFADTLAEARSVKSELQADIIRGEYTPRSQVALAEYAREWIDTYQGRTSRGFKESTRRDYRAATPHQWTRAHVPHAATYVRIHVVSTRLQRQQVQVLLGHHSPAFTLERYVHLIEQDLPSVDDLYV